MPVSNSKGGHTSFGQLGDKIMIDHISIPVRDLARSISFYEKVLAPLGLRLMITREATAGFGVKYPEFWLNLRSAFGPLPDGWGCHVALRAPDEEAVRAFHAAALLHGGRSAGEPGVRGAMMSEYFGAYILDLDGNKVEALKVTSTK